jgi:urocanate hydratase
MTPMKARLTPLPGCSAEGKHQPAKLYFRGYSLIENRHDFVVQADAMQATGKAKRAGALAMIDRQDPGSMRRPTLAADKAYDNADLVSDMRQKSVSRHVAAKGIGVENRRPYHAARG